MLRQEGYQTGVRKDKDEKSAMSVLNLIIKTNQTNQLGHQNPYGELTGKVVSSVSSVSFPTKEPPFEEPDYSKTKPEVIKI